jgi:Carbohydrate binding module (family 6)/Right handed beta helix region
MTSMVCLAATLAAGYAHASTLTVNAGGDLQAALNAAQPGDTILLQAGATFTGNFVLPVKSGSTADITIRSSAADSSLPAAGVRMTPAYAALLPKIRSNSNGAALATAPGTSHWRLLFLEFYPQPGTTTADLLELGATGSKQNTTWQIPQHFTVDRSYFHGDATVGQRRGIALNSGDTKVINSYFADFKGKNVDTQAICGWNGPGPYLVENNYLEAAGENIMFGGSDPNVPNLVPTGITIRRNLISRPMAWINQGWTVKNLVEFKNAQNVLVEGNIIENHWVGGQQGSAIVLTPRNQSNTAPWSVVRDVTVQNNVIRHISSGFNILGYDNLAPSQQTENIVVRNNLLYDVDPKYTSSSTAGPARFAIIGAGPKNVTFDHNTVDNAGAATIYFYGGATPTGVQIAGFTLTNNLLKQNSWAIYGDAIGQGLPALTHYAPGGTVLGNTFAGASAKLYPVGNDFPTVTQWLADFTSRSAGNYTLVSTSLSRGAATDGKDIGVDFTELNAAFAVPPVVNPPADPTPAPQPGASTPYTGTPIALPGRIEAENYDKGGEGVAYHDTTAGNTGGKYRTNNVDIQASGDTGGGYNIGWTAKGEWLKYSVQSASARTYAIDVRVASNGAGGTFHIEIDGVNVTGTMTAPNTGAWQTYTTVTKTNVSVTAGPHVVKLVMDGTGANSSVGNFNWIAFR